MAELPFVIKNLDYLLIPQVSAAHSSADQQVVYEMDHTKIGSLIQASSGFDDFFHNVRIDILKFLVETGYSNFNDKPYQADGNFAITVQS
jgi:hypothetical protein